MIYPFHLLWTLILKILGKSPELGILCSFQTHSYLFSPYPLPWQADLHWFHQWAPRSSGFLFGSANGRHMQFREQGQREVRVFITCFPLYRLWVDRDYSSIEGHHFHCVTLSYSYSRSHNFSNSSPSVPDISLFCSFWLRGSKVSTLILVLCCYTISHIMYSAEYRTDYIICGAQYKMKMEETVQKLLKISRWQPRGIKLSVGPF